MDIIVTQLLAEEKSYEQMQISSKGNIMMTREKRDCKEFLVFNFSKPILWKEH